MMQMTTPELPNEATTGDGVPDAADRHVSPYSRREKIARLVWAVVQGTVFRYSFTTWYGVRNRILRTFGATVHPTCRIRRTARFECPWNLTVGRNTAIGDGAIIYCLGPVTIGERVSISQYAHICAGTHDFTRPDMPLIRPPITIEDDVWIATEAFVGPNVTVGRSAILGARGCAFRDLEGGMIHGGNPARALRPRPETEAPVG
jgi:putative colanic acid biosynthesis acetyltransferase WcaF